MTGAIRVHGGQVNPRVHPSRCTRMNPTCTHEPNALTSTNAGRAPKCTRDEPEIWTQPGGVHPEPPAVGRGRGFTPLALATTEEKNMAARKIPMTTAQHIEHGSKLKAAHRTLADLQRDLYVAARGTDPAARAVRQALATLTTLRYALENVALQDYPIQFGEESDWTRLYARTDREFQA